MYPLAENMCTKNRQMALLLLATRLVRAQVEVPLFFDNSTGEKIGNILEPDTNESLTVGKAQVRFPEADFSNHKVEVSDADNQ